MTPELQHLLNLVDELDDAAWEAGDQHGQGIYDRLSSKAASDATAAKEKAKNNLVQALTAVYNLAQLS